jgi:hypothetical protein
VGLIVGQVEACFGCSHVNGPVDLPCLKATLRAAKSERFDPRRLYSEALGNLPSHKRVDAPAFETLLP